MKYLLVVQKPSNNLLLGPNSEYLQNGVGDGGILFSPLWLSLMFLGHVNVHEEES